MNNTIKKDQNIDKHEGEYLLSFVEEFGFNTKYADWVWGRIEVDIYTEVCAIDEIDFRFPHRSKEWNLGKSMILISGMQKPLKRLSG